MKTKRSFLNFTDKVVYPVAKTDGSAAIASMMKKLKNEKKIIIGINSTNRAIIQKTIKLVIFASNGNPQMLTDHILYLCAQKKIPVITSSFSPLDLGKELNMKSIAAAGILNTTEESIIKLLLPYSEIIQPESIPLYNPPAE